jgi:DNA-binding PadR family transcriptional regulator
MWILVVLRDGPYEIARLLDAVRLRDGPIGPGTLFSAVARLEGLTLVEPAVGAGGRPAYRLTELGKIATGSVVAVQREEVR